MSRLADGLLLGLGATALMDLWNLVLLRAFGVPSLDYCLLGRWVRHMPGRFRHHTIHRAAPKSHECPVGWATHYAIGVSLALSFALGTPAAWFDHPTPARPLAFGIASVVLPFLVLQPALGLGPAAALTPHPGRARVKSLATHTVFGIGLYLAAQVLAP